MASPTEWGHALGVSDAAFGDQPANTAFHVASLGRRAPSAAQ